MPDNKEHSAYLQACFDIISRQLSLTVFGIRAGQKAGGTTWQVRESRVLPGEPLSLLERPMATRMLAPGEDSVPMLKERGLFKGSMSPNIGIPAGLNNLMILDLDLKDGETLETGPVTGLAILSKVLSGLKIPFPQAFCKTRSGGIHYLIHLPGSMDRVKCMKDSPKNPFAGAGIDIITGRNYVVAPGSRVDGQYYLLLEGACINAAWPSDFVDSFIAFKESVYVDASSAVGVTEDNYLCCCPPDLENNILDAIEYLEGVTLSGGDRHIEANRHAIKLKCLGLSPETANTVLNEHWNLKHNIGLIPDGPRVANSIPKAMQGVWNASSSNTCGAESRYIQMAGAFTAQAYELLHRPVTVAQWSGPSYSWLVDVYMKLPREMTQEALITIGGDVPALKEGYTGRTDTRAEMTPQQLVTYQPDRIFGNLIYAGSLSVIHARPGAGKTTLAGRIMIDAGVGREQSKGGLFLPFYHSGEDRDIDHFRVPTCVLMLRFEGDNVADIAAEVAANQAGMTCFNHKVGEDLKLIPYPDNMVSIDMTNPSYDLKDYTPDEIKTFMHQPQIVVGSALEGFKSNTMVQKHIEIEIQKLSLNARRHHNLKGLEVDQAPEIVVICDNIDNAVQEMQQATSIDLYVLFAKKLIRQYGVTFISLHHSASDESGGKMSGSARINRLHEDCLYLSRDKGTKVTTITAHKTRNRVEEKTDFTFTRSRLSPIRKLTSDQALIETGGAEDDIAVALEFSHDFFISRMDYPEKYPKSVGKEIAQTAPTKPKVNEIVDENENGIITTF